MRPSAGPNKSSATAPPGKLPLLTSNVPLRTLLGTMAITTTGIAWLLTNISSSSPIFPSIASARSVFMAIWLPDKLTGFPEISIRPPKVFAASLG